jgi:hypothetical protein
MEPGPVLAGFAEDAIDAGLSVLSDDELVGMMGAARRLASRAAVIELAAVAGLEARRAADALAMGDWRQHDHVADEIAAALTLTCRAADKLLDLAAGVTRLPAVTAALAAGRIDLPKASVYHHELAALGDVAAAAIAAVTITDAAGLTTGQLREVLHRAVLAHDPEAARKRREKAQKDARVESWPEHRGTAALAGRDLPPADVLAADKHIDALARELKKAGADGTLEQLRAKVFLALLTSQPLYPAARQRRQRPERRRAGHLAAPQTTSRPSDGDVGGSSGSSPGAVGTGDRPGRKPAAKTMTATMTRAGRRRNRHRTRAGDCAVTGLTRRAGVPARADGSVQPHHPLATGSACPPGPASRGTAPGRRHQPRPHPPRRPARQPMVPDHHQPKRPRHRTRLRPRRTRATRARRGPAPMAGRGKDHMAGDRSLRARPGNPRLPALARPAAPDQNPRPHLLLPRLPPPRTPLR